LIQTIDLLGFLTLGLLGGFGHCVGMCSPFVLFVSRRYGAQDAGPGRSAHLGRGTRRTAFAAQLWYTAGRIVTYALLGAVAGALGGVVEMAGGLLGVQRAASVVAGAVLVAWALVALADSAPLRSVARFLPHLPLWDPASSGLLARLQRRVPGHPFTVGLFLGLLPCGLLYSAIIAAVARGGPVEGAAALTLFGAGTAPALLGISVADEFLARNRAFVNRLSQVFLLAMGTWFVWTGFSG